MSDITRKLLLPGLSITSTFFVRDNVARGGGGYVMTIEILTLAPFCLEKTSVRKLPFQALSCVFSLLLVEKGKICQHNNHTCLFHCLGRCFNTQPDGLVFKTASS